MLLRRVIEHVRTQNWTAVGLDFIIVVVGIWVALMAGQWADERNRQSARAVAEQDLNHELGDIYYAAHERLASISCRRERYGGLSALLLSEYPKWPGSPNEYGDGALTKYRVLPFVLRSPNRVWSHQVWDTELSKGTLDSMEAQKRLNYALAYAQAKNARQYQEEIYSLESRLAALAHPLEMTISDRLKYYDLLAEADAQSALLEIVAEEIVDNIETNDLISFDEPSDIAAMRELFAEANAGMSDIYGDCFAPITYSVLEKESTAQGTQP